MTRVPTSCNVKVNPESGPGYVCGFLVYDKDGPKAYSRILLLLPAQVYSAPCVSLHRLYTQSPKALGSTQWPEKGGSSEDIGKTPTTLGNDMYRERLSFQHCGFAV